MPVPSLHPLIRESRLPAEQQGDLAMGAFPSGQYPPSPHPGRPAESGIPVSDAIRQASSTGWTKPVSIISIGGQWVTAMPQNTITSNSLLESIPMPLAHTYQTSSFLGEPRFWLWALPILTLVVSSIVIWNWLFRKYFKRPEIDLQREVRGRFKKADRFRTASTEVIRASTEKPNAELVLLHDSETASQGVQVDEMRFQSGDQSADSQKQNDLELEPDDEFGFTAEIEEERCNLANREPANDDELIEGPSSAVAGNGLLNYPGVFEKNSEVANENSQSPEAESNPAYTGFRLPHEFSHNSQESLSTMIRLPSTTAAERPKEDEFEFRDKEELDDDGNRELNSHPQSDVNRNDDDGSTEPAPVTESAVNTLTPATSGNESPLDRTNESAGELSRQIFGQNDLRQPPKGSSFSRIQENVRNFQPTDDAGQNALESTNQSTASDLAAAGSSSDLNSVARQEPGVQHSAAHSGAENPGDERNIVEFILGAPTSLADEQKFEHGDSWQDLDSRKIVQINDESTSQLHRDDARSEKEFDFQAGIKGDTIGPTLGSGRQARLEEFQFHSDQPIEPVAQESSFDCKPIPGAANVNNEDRLLLQDQIFQLQQENHILKNSLSSVQLEHEQLMRTIDSSIELSLRLEAAEQARSKILSELNTVKLQRDEANSIATENSDQAQLTQSRLQAEIDSVKRQLEIQQASEATRMEENEQAKAELLAELNMAKQQFETEAAKAATCQQRAEHARSKLQAELDSIKDQLEIRQASEATRMEENEQAKAELLAEFNMTKRQFETEAANAARRQERTELARLKLQAELDSVKWQLETQSNQTSARLQQAEQAEVSLRAELDSVTHQLESESSKSKELDPLRSQLATLSQENATLSVELEVVKSELSHRKKENHSPSFSETGESAPEPLDWETAKTPDVAGETQEVDAELVRRLKKRLKAEYRKRKAAQAFLAQAEEQRDEIALALRDARHQRNSTVAFQENADD